MSKKSKWKESFQKARSISQTSLASSNSLTMDLRRTSSVMNEETTDQELKEYLRALKQKSGLKNLWSGDKFLKAVRDEEDKTPDISISSEEDIDEELMTKSFSDHADDDDDDDDDFKPKLMMLSWSPSPEDHDATESSVNPFQGIQLQLDDLDLNKVDLNNNSEYKVSISDDNVVSETKEIKSINNDLSAVVESELDTEDVDEIEEDTGGIRTESEKDDEKLQRNDTPVNYDYSSFKSDQDNDVSMSERTLTENYSKSRKSSKTGSFCESERTDLTFRKKKSKHSKSYKKQSSSHTSENSSSLKSSRNKHKSRKRQNTSECNRLTREVGVQTSNPNSVYVPSGLGIGMATSSPALGMQYVDPSPIATHAVASEALEAITAYNPAVIALNDMLRQQIQLVDQFVESNRRMYEAYTRNISTNHRYTTLEDTLQYIKQNRPSVITMEEALEAIKRDEE